MKTCIVLDTMTNQSLIVSGGYAQVTDKATETVFDSKAGKIPHGAYGTTKYKHLFHGVIESHVLK